MTASTENRKIAPPTQLQGAWNAWLARLPDCVRATPWPFPVGVHAQLGLVRNVSAPAPPKQKKARGKPPGSVVKLRVAEGDVPPQGSVLQFDTGRRYQVQAWVGRTIWCLVLDPAAKLKHGTLVLPWLWASRAERLHRLEELRASRQP